MGADVQAVASGVHNTVGQLAGLLMIAVLPAVAGLSGLGFDDPDFANGYRLATQVCAGLCIVAAAVAVFTIPSSPARAEAEERANEGSDGLPPIRVTIDSGPSVNPCLL